MATTYQQFLDQYTREMWREGDTAWEQDLPQLIKKAEARINRDVRIEELGLGLVLRVEEAVGEVALPPNTVREITSVLMGYTSSAAKWYTPLQLSFTELRQKWSNETEQPFDYQYYARRGDNLIMKVNGSVEDPALVGVRYYGNLVPYDTNPIEPFYDANPDFYEAALGVQAYKYLKDMDMSAECNTQYEVLLDSMRRDREYKIYSSGNIGVRLPGNVL